jgi:hypothetical protein
MIEIVRYSIEQNSVLNEFECYKVIGNYVDKLNGIESDATSV